MKKNMTFHKRKIWVVLLCCILMMTGLIGRLVYLMCFRSDYYYKKAKELHEREGDQSGQRGDSGCKGKSSGIKQDGMYNLCNPQSD